jgi:hypothetical protein
MNTNQINTIDEVISELQKIISECETNNNNLSKGAVLKMIFLMIPRMEPHSIKSFYTSD